MFCVAVKEFFNLLITIAALCHFLCDLWKIGHRRKAKWQIGAVEIATKCQEVLTAKREKMLDVPKDRADIRMRSACGKMRRAKAYSNDPA